MRNVRFLVVDDSAMARSLIASIIRARLGGEKIRQAASGREAILLLQEQPADIIISDWNMEQISGAELLQYVRRHERLRHVPFIMVTTNAGREFIVHAFQLGVTNYLVKPFTPAELEQRVRTAWHNANRRGTERHCELPRHRVLFKTGDRLAAGELLNLSLTGALMRVGNADLPALQCRCELSISFRDPDSGGQWQVPTIVGTTVRLEANGSDQSLVALRIDPEALPPDAAAPFTRLIDWLGARSPRLVGNGP